MAATQAPTRAMSRWLDAGRGVMAAVAIAYTCAAQQYPRCRHRFTGWLAGTC